MNKPGAGLITIQKFIYLLDDEHYAIFVNHLANTKATLPLKLAQTIRVELPGFDSHEILCEKIYGSFEKGPKQNFNQLAAYTFRLSNVLAQNHPGYLIHNINKIEQLVNEGRGIKANFIAEILQDIAERTCDFQCSIFVLNFLSQQAFVVKDIAVGLKLDAQLAHVLAQEKTFTQIQLLGCKALSPKRKDQNDLKAIETHLIGFANDGSPAISVLSRYYYLLILHQFDLPAFNKPETGNMLRQLEKDLNNHAHVIFPYGLDLRGNLQKIKDGVKALSSHVRTQTL